jgi:hypothetical protein
MGRYSKYSLRYHSRPIGLAPGHFLQEQNNSAEMYQGVLQRSKAVPMWRGGRPVKHNAICVPLRSKVERVIRLL